MLFDDQCLLERKAELIQQGYSAYVLYTLSGNENSLADSLNRRYPCALATPLQKISHVSKNGIKSTVIKPVLNGYVFLYISNEVDPKLILADHASAYRLLGKKDQLGKLYSTDLEYANWVLEIDGLIGISQAKKENGLVKIISGPLKDMEGKILLYSKKNRNCKVRIEFAQQMMDVWLPFEWVLEED